MKSIMGIHDASLGARSNETSGRAIMARQREGDVSTFHFIDNLSRSIRQVGRICGDLIPKIYNDERVIRVIGEDGSNKQVKVNGEYQDEDGRIKIHDLSAGKYDLIVKSGPSFTTRREEAATQMMELLRSFPAAAPIIGDLIAQNLDWPGADEIAERLKAMLPQQLQGQAGEQIPEQVQQMIQQGQQQMQQMGQELQKLQQENQQLKQDLQNKQADIQIKGQEMQQDGEIQAAEIQLKQRELAIKEREVALKEKQLEIDAWQAMHAAMNPPEQQPGGVVPEAANS